MSARRLGLGLALTAALFAACGPTVPDNESFSSTRLLDRACADGGCSLEGSAKQVTGLTTDSIGFEIGPGPGSITIPIPSAEQPGTPEVLVKGHGQTTSFSVPEDYDWRETLAQPTGPSSAVAYAIVSVEDDSKLTIADLRVHTYLDPGECSVVAPGAGRRSEAPRRLLQTLRRALGL